MHPDCDNRGGACLLCRLGVKRGHLFKVRRVPCGQEDWLWMYDRTDLYHVMKLVRVSDAFAAKKAGYELGHEMFVESAWFQFRAIPAGVWSDLCPCNNANVDPQSSRCEECVHYPTDGGEIV